MPSADQDQPASPYVLAAVTLTHRWADRRPQALYGKSLRVCYRLRSDGVVTRQLVGLDDPTGVPIASPHRAFAWLDWSERQEHGGSQGMGSPVVLDCDPAEPAEPVLLTWLEAVGLKSEGDD